MRRFFFYGWFIVTDFRLVQAIMYTSYMYPIVFWKRFLEEFLFV